jgi:2-keto-4-pentenoate hydratase
MAGFAEGEAKAHTFAPITDLDKTVTMAQAYALQKRIVANRLASGDKVTGFKGGLMSAKSLAGRGVTEPLTGVLFASGAVASGQGASLCGYRRAAFEMKLGYVFSKPVKSPLASVAQLKTYVQAVRPVVELPDIAYRDAKTYGAIDMAAANISSARYVLGPASRPGVTDLNAVTVTMRRGGDVITTGKGSDSLGDQWESLRTVVNRVIANGSTVSAGNLVITGKIGDKGDITPARYSADFGPLGKVAFEAQPCKKQPS